MKKFIITYLILLVFIVFVVPSCTSDVPLEDEIEENKDDKKTRTRKKNAGSTNSKVNKTKKDLSKKCLNDNKSDNSKNVKGNEVGLEIEYKIITNKNGESYIEGSLLSNNGKFITLPISIEDKAGIKSNIIPYYKSEKELDNSKNDSWNVQKGDIPSVNDKKNTLPDIMSPSSRNSCNESTTDIKSIILKLIKNFCYLKSSNRNDKSIPKNNEDNKPYMDGVITNLASNNNGVKQDDAKQNDAKQDFESFLKNFINEQSRGSKQSKIDSTSIKNESDIISPIPELSNNNFTNSLQEISQPQCIPDTCKKVEEKDFTQADFDNNLTRLNNDPICDKFDIKNNNKKQYILPPSETITHGLDAQTQYPKKNEKIAFDTSTFSKENTSNKNQEGIENNKMTDNLTYNGYMPYSSPNYMSITNNAVDNINPNNSVENSLEQNNKQNLENKIDNISPYIDDNNACNLPLPFKQDMENNKSNNNKWYPQLSNYRMDPYNNNRPNANNIPYICDSNDNIQPVYAQQEFNNTNTPKESEDNNMKSDDSTDTISEDDLFSDIDETCISNNNVENNNGGKKSVMRKIQNILKKEKVDINSPENFTLVEV